MRSLSNVIRLMPSGNIIAAVAVLLIHMLISAVANITPPMRFEGRVPAANTVHSASRRCRFQRSIASAIKNPPINKNTFLSA